MAQSDVVKSSKRVIEILETFDKQRRPLSLHEMVTLLKYPVSSAAALLKSLVTLGYLSYDVYSRSYLPTTRIASLGSWIWESVVDQRVLELMTRLNQLTGDTVTLSTLSGTEVQYLHVIPSVQPWRFEVSVGFRRAVAVSGTGWVLLSALNDEQIEDLVRQINFRERERSKKVQLAALMERVEGVRSAGYAFSKHMILPGGGAIAKALPQAPFQRQFAIAVHGVVDHLARHESAILKIMRGGLRK